MNRLLVVAATLALLTALAGCGGDGDAAEPEVTNELRFANGDLMDSGFVPDRVTCGPSRFDKSVQAVKVKQSNTQESFLYVEVAPVTEPTTYDVPADRTRVLITFASEVTQLSTAKNAPEDAGEIEVLEASCDPARLVLRVDTRLGRSSSGPGLTLTGGIDLTGE